MRDLLSRLLIKVGENLREQGERLQTEQQRLEGKAMKPLPDIIVPKRSMVWSLDAKTERSWLVWTQKWFEANGFPPNCQQCLQYWTQIESITLFPRSIDDYMPDIPPELVGKLPPGHDRAVILGCDNGHKHYGSYNTLREVPVTTVLGRP